MTCNHYRTGRLPGSYCRRCLTKVDQGLRWWLVWRGTRCALVRARLATEARAVGAELLGRYGAGRSLPGTKLVVRRATAADAAAFRSAHGQAQAGAGACRLAS